MTLEEIVDDYLKNFYYKRYSQSKSENVEKRVQNSKKIAAIDAVSIRKYVVPNSIDFGSAINETPVGGIREEGKGSEING